MKVLTKKMLRSIGKSRGQVLAVAAVIMCGTACYIALTSCHRNLMLTRDTYYSQYRFADFEIMLERAPVTTLYKIEEIPGVRQVRGRIVEEVKLEIEGVEEARTGRIVSMPDRPLNVLNNIMVKEGRYFEPGALDEVILSEDFALANGLGIGDSLDATIDGRQHTLRIVGLGLGPEYVYIIRNIQELIPAPGRFGILWVPEKFAEDAMSMQAACNNIVGSVENQEALDRILDVAEDLLEPYGVFAKVKQKDQISNNFLSQEIRGLGATARVLPTIFLGVASLVLLILLNRMVRNERTQIGLMKAYGYSNLTVGMHYLQFALIVAFVGCVAGFVAGQMIAKYLISFYVEFYKLPTLQSRIYPDVLAKSMVISTVFSLMGAIVAARKAAAISPAESMRPPSPRIGKRTVFERMTMVWSRMTFTWKMIARNMSRNWFRSALNTFGVMISCTLLIVGLFSIDAMNFIMEYQFETTQRQDVKISFMLERGKAAMHEAARLDYVREAEPVLEYPFELKTDWRSKDILIMGVLRDSDLRKLMDTDGNEVDVGEHGLILSTGLAESLRLNVGDDVVLKPLMGRITDEKTVRISKIVEQFFGSTGYMNIEALSKVLDEPFAMNGALLRTEPGMERSLHDELKDVPLVSSVEIKADSLKSIMDTLAESMWVMSIAGVLFAGVISFAVIYNVTLVSLSERERELASLRVMGFTKQEVGSILYYENLLTGVLGILLGLPAGYAMVYGMASAYENELFRFPVYVEPNSFAIAAAISVCFVAIANFAVRHKIHGLDMVETLKARE